jgi:hypothetical protein
MFMVYKSPMRDARVEVQAGENVCHLFTDSKATKPKPVNADWQKSKAADNSPA